MKPRQRKKRDHLYSLGGHADPQASGRQPPSPIDDEASQDGDDDPADEGSPQVFDLIQSPMETASHFVIPFEDLPQTSTSYQEVFGGTEEGTADVEEIVRHDQQQHSALVTSPSHQPDLAMIAPIPVCSPRLEFIHPAFSEFSDRPNRRALVDHFCNVLSHLIVFREESGNPFQQLVLPLCHKSPACMNAIYALASAHLEYRGLGNAEKSVSFHHKAIQALARLIAQEDRADPNELLAAIMLLVYYEVVSVWTSGETEK